MLRTYLMPQAVAEFMALLALLVQLMVARPGSGRMRKERERSAQELTNRLTLLSIFLISCSCGFSETALPRELRS
jgi:hypothetical protein